MKQESYELFQTKNLDEITSVLEAELSKRNESPIWRERTVPFAKAILSVLIPLRDNNMLFSPEGKMEEKLTPELFLSWSDFVSLKTLAFTIQKSNNEGRLLRTSLSESTCKRYKEIDLKILGNYLSANSVNLEDELLDFPIANYNLHQGVSNVIKSLL